MEKDLANIRTDYTKLKLGEDMLQSNPFTQFEKWMNEALAQNVMEPNAMTIATVNTEGKPSLRVVLLKGFDEKGFVFFTNYESRKGEELLQNPSVALNFFWITMERQVRIEGIVKKIDEAASTSYFQSRPKESQISAWASPQSREVESREVLENKVQDLEKQYQSDAVLPKPEFWGGYIVEPTYFEFWQGRANRLHDRLVFEKSENSWKMKRIAP